MFENWSSNTIFFISFSIEIISTGPPFLKCCVPVQRVLLERVPTFSTIKLIKVYTFRILGRRSYESHQERPYLDRLLKSWQLLLYNTLIISNHRWSVYLLSGAFSEIENLRSWSILLQQMVHDTHQIVNWN